MESSLHLFPATLDALPQAQAYIANCWREVDAGTLLRMQLAIEELFVNSVNYESFPTWYESERGCEFPRRDESERG